MAVSGVTVVAGGWVVGGTGAKLQLVFQLH